MYINFIKNISFYSLISGLVLIAPLYASLADSASEKREESTRKFAVEYLEKSYHFSLREDATALDIKKALADRLHIPLNEIHIILGGKSVPDTMLLSYIEAERSILAVRRKAS